MKVDLVGEFPRYGRRPITAVHVDDDDLIAPAEGFQAAPEVFLLVPSQDKGGDIRHFA